LMQRVLAGRHVGAERQHSSGVSHDRVSQDYAAIGSGATGGRVALGGYPPRATRTLRRPDPASSDPASTREGAAIEVVLLPPL
jgi:hypothetical protein